MAKIYAAGSPEITEREKEHMELSRQLAGECVVLLENNGVLPLSGGKKLALFGNGAADTVKGGTGSGDVNTRTNIGIEQGLEENGFTILTKDWLSRQRRKRADEKAAYLDRASGNPVDSFLHPFQEIAPVEITEADLEAADTDTAVYVIARNSGEGADRYDKRGDYLLFEEEKAQLQMLAERYAHVVVVLNVGGILDMAEIREISGIDAVLLMAQLGNVGGYVLADVLSGRVTPSGKLTDTWAEHYSDYPSSASFSHNNGNLNDEYYTEGIYVGYRYFDAFGVDPVYCFGYGKSYTDFAIRTEQVSVENGRIVVSVSVENIGKTYSGKEVVQVYYSAPQQSLAKPYQELAAYGKTGLLAPGESETLQISFEVRDMASYSKEEAAWILEAGEYLLRVGNSSRDTFPAAVLVLKETVKTEAVRNLFADSVSLEEISAPDRAAYGEEADPELVRMVLDPGTVDTRTAVYQEKREEMTTDQTKQLTLDDVREGRCTVEELTAQLSIEEMAELCVGTMRMDGGSVVGNASYMVPGAAGDTSAILEESRGIKTMILADGPAGLRLQPVFKTDKEGKLLPGGMILGDIVEGFSPEYTEENSDTYYQYCTAIPIGWALAQSWNTALLEEIGDMVGREMELFGIDLWLAPALNIHRNPLCGRNFEYYSEDPLISGKTAAAITRGVQKHKGKGTTIKHFAVNNQEDNRYFTNAHVSERALREIYLKGFEIAVKESQPLSIMTSYNLLNGIHTANHYELVQSVARDEWGFEGVIMSDWFTSQEQPAMDKSIKVIYPISASTGCIYAGNDIQMPGCQKNVDDLVETLRDGKEIDGYPITLADLQFNAANVIRAVIKTTS